MRSKKTGNAIALTPLATDDFSTWLSRTRRAQTRDAGASVACGDCRGCCTSSYFIHIRPDESATLARIPKALQFVAPGLPKGHMLLGYNSRGHCPMLIDIQCSIYEDRPQTCRNYDCRIFPATGFAVHDKPLIVSQSERWQFGFAGAEDRRHFAAVQAAAKFLERNAAYFPDEFIPNNPTQQAVVAIKIYEVFLDMPDTDEADDAAAIRATVQAVVATYQQFSASTNNQ